MRATNGLSKEDMTCGGSQGLQVGSLLERHV